MTEFSFNPFLTKTDVGKCWQDKYIARESSNSHKDYKWKVLCSLSKHEEIFYLY